MQKKKKIYPMAKPYLGKKEEDYVLRVLRSGQLSIGPYLEKFEKEFAKRAGTRYACGVSSGTAGLHLALIAAGVGPGDEGITSPFSFFSSAQSPPFILVLYQYLPTSTRTPTTSTRTR